MPITLQLRSAPPPAAAAPAPPQQFPISPPPAVTPASPGVTGPLGVVVRSEGQRQLIAVPATLREIAENLGGAVSVQAVSAWRRGEKVPAAGPRAGLAAVYGIAPETWGYLPVAAPAAGPPAPPQATPRAKLTTSSPNSLADCHALLALIRDARGDNMLPSELGKTVDSEARVLALLARLEAQHELREDRYVREHPAWHRTRRVIIEALAPYPIAAKAVIDALRKANM